MNVKLGKSPSSDRQFDPATVTQAETIQKTKTIKSIYGIFWLLCVAQILFFAAVVSPGVPPDEYAHLAYVEYLRETPTLLPRFEEMNLLAEDSRWRNTKLFVAHPPLYYFGVGFLLGNTEGLDRDALTLRARWVSVPVGVITISLLLLIGYRSRLPWIAHMMFAAAVTFIPGLCFMLGALNNDVLAILAGAFVVLGLQSLETTGEGRKKALLIGGGLFLALMAKATAGLLCGFLVFFFVGWKFLTVPDRRRSLVALVLWAGLLCTPAMGYNFAQSLRYGAIIPSLESVDPEAAQRWVPDSLRVPEDSRTVRHWAVGVARTAGATWVNICGHRWTDRDAKTLVLGLLILPVLAILGLVRKAPSGLESMREIGIFAALAVAMILILNLWNSWQAYSVKGWLGGVHARYYYPLLAPILLASVLPIARYAGRRSIRALAIVLVLWLGAAQVDVLLQVSAWPRSYPPVRPICDGLLLPDVDRGGTTINFGS
ncbi:MAG: hypothetical protein GY906_13855 [bacterium]|nr:hypothetical protein [bacterium]